MTKNEQEIIAAYHSFLNDKDFPCIGAKTALAREQIYTMVAGGMNCPSFDGKILEFIYDSIGKFKKIDNNFYSAAVIFTGPLTITEEIFEQLLWQKLQSLLDLDALHYPYNKKVSNDPKSVFFSLSLKEETFFIIGLHPDSSRKARRFIFPALVFNPTDQFVKLKQSDKFEKLKHTIRKRDMAFSGSVNPMLGDYGSTSEILQYSGKGYDSNFVCPLKINHDTI